MEQWVLAKGCDDRYLVSNLGNVKSVNTGIIRRPTLGKRGYYSVLLSLGSAKKCKLKTIHRLVAENFIPNPDNKPFVNHKDGNKQNNSIDNLEWCTNGENIQHAYDNGMMETRPVRQLTMDGMLVKIWDTLTHTRKYYNMNASNIVSVCKGRRKSAYGYRWEYV